MAILLALLPVGAQRAEKLPLTVDTLMRGPGLYGYAPRNLRWSGDSQRVYFEWKRHDEAPTADYSTYVVDRHGIGLRKLSEEEAKDAPPLSGDETLDWKLAVTARQGDLYLYDNMAGRAHRITRTRDAESSPRFTADQKRIAFLRGGNLFVLTPRTGALEQLTDIRPPGARMEDDEETKGNGTQEFLKAEEKSLLETVKERAARAELDKSRRKKENPRKPFRLEAKQSVEDLYLSPDESYVVALVREADPQARTAVPNYVTEAGYTGELSARPKVGDRPARIRALLLDVASGEAEWLSSEQDWLPPRWSDDGNLVMLARAPDNKDAWLMAVNPQTAKTRVLVSMHDDAWLSTPAGPGYGWLAGNARVYFTWERDGWGHLYTVRYDNGGIRQLTSGAWEVRDVRLSNGRSHFLLTTSEVDAGEEHLYRMSADGGARTRITVMPGGHEARLSPDETMVATIHSYGNKPPELHLHPPGAEKSVQVTQSPAPEFATYPWIDPPIVRIPARDGKQVPARLYKPANWTRGGPLVMFVHGAGYLQNVHRQWSSYGREYLFHHLLMERGYLVLDLDYRASAGYGREWRTAIYRHMGGKDLDDQVDAVQWAVREHGADPRRAGIYGGSYGGFITLMALFTQPDVFRAGAALRPVTDWAHYNHGYTSNILNIPQQDAEAYRRSSPIYHVQGLKGALLLCHGVVDVNVHFQDTIRLVQRLIELRKENWELAAYPVEDHAFVQPSSWADEYKRILKLFETNLK